MADVYARIGGARAVAELVDEIIDRLAANLLIRRFQVKDLAQVKSSCLPSFEAMLQGASLLDIRSVLSAADIELDESEAAGMTFEVVCALRERGLAPADIREVMELLRCAHGGHGGHDAEPRSGAWPA